MQKAFLRRQRARFIFHSVGALSACAMWVSACVHTVYLYNIINGAGRHNAVPVLNLVTHTPEFTWNMADPLFFWRCSTAGWRALKCKKWNPDAERQQAKPSFHFSARDKRLRVSSSISLAELQLKNKRCGRLTVSCVATKTVWWTSVSPREKSGSFILLRLFFKNCEKEFSESFATCRGG